mgnify:CR=1 FL=1
MDGAGVQPRQLRPYPSQLRQYLVVQRHGPSPPHVVSKGFHPFVGYRYGLANDVKMPSRSLEVKFTAGYILPKDATEAEPADLPWDIISHVVSKGFHPGRPRLLVEGPAHVGDGEGGKPLGPVRDAPGLPLILPATTSPWTAISGSCTVTRAGPLWDTATGWRTT